MLQTVRMGPACMPSTARAAGGFYASSKRPDASVRFT
jgi:hypothetical protein